MIGRRIAHYEIQRRIGEGGMGEVWVARDLRLGRAVALKRVRTERVDERMRKRLWREARSAASVNHPNVCQVYDVVEENDELFLAMELLDGESLEKRLERGPLPVRDAITILREILRALSAVHDAGLVHRDLKPGNVVLTAHGVKLLDFGLSRAQATGFTGTQTAITREGQAVGTPRYMSPEQWAGDGVGPPSDIFAAGAMFYEMMSGRPAIVGSTIREVMEDAVSGRPPVLHGDPEMTKMERVIRRSMARAIVDRYSSARSMLEDLDESLHETVEHAAPVEDHYARVAVLPFRMLRPDPEIDFLASSLPEAIIASLSSMGSVIVCSPPPSPSASSGAHDIADIARRTACNAVLSGTILRAGSQVRVTSQLLQAPEGNVIRAQTSQGALDDIFRLQDDITNDIVRSLPIDREGMNRRGSASKRPSNGKAYELYLRANQLATQRRNLPEAAALYRECLDLDPGWAPAWAMLGRVYRVLAKFEQKNAEENFERAQQAFRRAFELDPDLSSAHNLYTGLEVEELGRSREAMVRLLERAKKRTTEPQLFVGLVLTCRFCGLIEESLAADRRARHLDPGVRTSVHYTYLGMGDWTRAIQYDDDKDMKFVTRMALFATGRTEDSISGVCVDTSTLPGVERQVIESLRAAQDMRRDECLAACRAVLDSRFRDPEGRFLLLRNLSRIGEMDLAISVLGDCVERGFHPRVMMDVDPWLAPLRAIPKTREWMSRMESAIAVARASYVEAGGPALLGVG